MLRDWASQLLLWFTQSLGNLCSWGFSFAKLHLPTRFQDNWGFKLSTRSKYICHSCGYSAEVWDEPDRAPIATVDTRHCLGCKSLVEVPIAFHAGSLMEDPDVVPSFLNRCPDCNSSNVKAWDDKHSCPRCGEHMTLPST